MNGKKGFARLALVAVMLIFFASSCTSLSSIERIRLDELKSQGAKIPHEEIKNPAAAGALNVLPGFGNFYLAIGDDGDKGHWTVGLFNLLTWPFSIAWGVPEAAIDAGVINKKNSLYYYTYGPGKKEMENKAVQSQPPPAAPPVK